MAASLTARDAAVVAAADAPWTTERLQQQGVRLRIVYVSCLVWRLPCSRSL